MAPGNDDGEKVLRIGVLQGVRVIEERILRKRGPVTIGSGPGCTFTLAAAEIPKSTTLFDVKGNSYVLCFSDGISGRLENNAGKSDFEGLKSRAEKQGELYRVDVDNTSKGRIRLPDGITVLFHFVAPPPVAAAAPMPTDIKGGVLRGVEPLFTAMLTASLALHAALALYVRVTEPPAPPSVEELKQLVERIQPPPKAELPPKREPKPTTDDGPKTGPGPGEDKPKKGGGEPASGGDGGGGDDKPAGKPGGGGGSGGAGDRGAIRDAIAGRGILQFIGARGGGAGGGGGAVGSVFGSGGSISDDIGSALQGTAGVGIAGGAGGGDGVTRRGTGGGGGGGDGSGGGVGGAALGIGELSTGGGGGGAKVDTGTKEVARVVARVKSDDVETVDGKIDKKSVSATIRRRQDGFQACYETALKANSKLQGKLVVEFTIAEDGKVADARVVRDGLNSAEVSGCVVALLKRLRFPAPEDGEVTISNSFVFQPGG